jgi:MFS family permease
VLGIGEDGAEAVAADDRAKHGPVWPPRWAWRDTVLGNANFRLLGTGQLTSTIGDYCYAVALPWVVLSTRGGVLLLGVLLACYGVPRAIAVPIGGILSDKVNPRSVMLTADLSRCVFVAVFAFLAAKRMDGIALLGPVAALIGAGEGIFLPASFTITPAILAAEDLQQGNALLSVITEIGAIAGPVVGGLLVATTRPAVGFAVDAASFAVSAATLARVKPRTPVSEDREHDITAPVSVLAMLRQSRVLQLIVLVCTVSNLAFGGTLQVALPALAHARFGASGYGDLVACLGAGSVAGSMLALRATARSRGRVIVCLSVLVESLAMALIPAASFLAGPAIAIVVFGVCMNFGNVVVITLIQQWAPPQALGRIMSLVMLTSVGVYPVSVAVAGLVVHRFGVGSFFVAGGTVLAVTVLIALTRRDANELWEAC